MYLLNELLLASPVVIYVGLRVRSLIGRAWLKNLWTVLFLLVAAAYPLAETVAHGRSGAWPVAVETAGYYGLPLLLYIVMTVLAVDLAVGLARVSGRLSRAAVRAPRFRAWRLAVSLAVPALVVIAGAVNHRLLRVREYRIDVPRGSSPARELTLVFMADLHLRDAISDRFLAELTAKVAAAKPDLVLLGGDLLEGDRRDRDTGRFERALRAMTSTYGTFAAPGNHERWSGAGESGFYGRAGIRLLEDETVAVGGALVLAGRRDQRSRGRAAVADLLAAAPAGLPVVLIAHRPVGFEEARRAGVDLQLSGHTHAGQLFPIDVLTRRSYDLNWGHLERAGAHLIVTSGVQGWGPPVRTVGASEIVVVRLSLGD